MGIGNICGCQIVVKFKTSQNIPNLKNKITMKTACLNVDKYRNLVQVYLNLHSYQTALFWADKVVALTGTPKDIYWLAHCMFLLKQYHRAAHLLKSRNLEKTFILCNYLTVKCLFEANEFTEALRVITLIDYDALSNTHNTQTSFLLNVEAMLFDESSKNQVFSSIFYLKGKVLECMENRGLAAECYKQSLHFDPHCYEAFDSLIKYQMLSAHEEQELLKSIPISQHCNFQEAEMLVTLYESKLKKYHAPCPPKVDSKYNFTSGTSISSLPSTPSIIVTPTSISTPNLIKTQDTKNEQESLDRNLFSKLANSLDLQVSEAERLYYNCDYQKCAELTNAILKEDPYHSACLPIYISCQVELCQSNNLFCLAHKLVDLYPNLAISWYAVGCFYYILDKSDLTRRYLAKATSLDRLFGPAWLAYGHSFAIDNEHDQAMAAYFKASQLMKGCHLPLLYIGLECGLTNNVRIAEKFFRQAQNIAPNDPFVMHEMGVIAFQNGNFKSAEKHFRDAHLQVSKIGNGVLPKRWESLLNNLGHTCRKVRKYEEALEFHQQALLLCPQSGNTYAAIAYCHTLMGNTEEAVDWFHKALGLKNDDPFCTTMLNYVIEQLTDEKPSYTDAPEEIPKFLDLLPSTNNTEMPDMSMSIEVDMADASGIIME